MVAVEEAERRRTSVSIGWGNPDGKLLCHVKELRGFGKMLRFTRKADQTFLLEADGLPPILGDTGTGGICNDEGSIRYVMLTLTGELASGVAYRLRPQNTSAGYRWKVTDDVVVTGR